METLGGDQPAPGRPGPGRRRPAPRGDPRLPLARGPPRPRRRATGTATSSSRLTPERHDGRPHHAAHRLPARRPSRGAPIHDHLRPSPVLQIGLPGQTSAVRPRGGCGDGCGCGAGERLRPRPAGVRPRPGPGRSCSPTPGLDPVQVEDIAHLAHRGGPRPAASTSPPSPPSPRTPSRPATSPPARPARSPACGSPRRCCPWCAPTSSRSSGTSRTATGSRPARCC